MVSTSEGQLRAARIRTGYHAWALALLLCPLSYVSLLLLHYFPVAGPIATILVALFVLPFALSTRDGRTEVSLWQGGVLALAAAVIVYSVARASDHAEQPAALAAALASFAQLALFWLFYTWMTAELAGLEIEAMDFSPRPARAHGTSRMSLSFLLFVSFVLYGAGAAWSRGDSRVPDPALWVVAQMFLTVGVMLLERLGFFERSAREGNLEFAQRSHRAWVAGAVLLLVTAVGLGAFGPRREAPPVPSDHPGNVQTEGAGAAPSAESSPLDQKLNDAGAAISVLATGVRATPGGQALLWLLLLLLLLLVALVWVFHRSRAARWLLGVVSAVLSRLVGLWRRLLAAVRRLWRRPARAGDGEPDAPAWGRDPLFDIFDHADLLAALSAREILLRAYHQVLHYGAMLGMGRLPGQTPLEYARALRLEGPAHAALQELTVGYVGAMYDSGEAPVPAPEAVRSAWRRVAEALTGRLPPEEVAARRVAYLEAQA